MKKFLTAFLFAVFLLSVPVFSEARSETQSPVSLDTSSELNQTVGVGRVYTRRRVRRRTRRRVRRHMRRRARIHYRVVRPRRRYHVMRH